MSEEGPGLNTQFASLPLQVAIDPIFELNYWQAFTNFWLFDTDESVIQQGAIGSMQKSLMGLIFNDFNKTVDDVPPGKSMALVIAMNQTYWNDTFAFPCGQSTLVDERGICDYAFHGLQVHKHGVW